MHTFCDSLKVKQTINDVLDTCNRPMHLCSDVKQKEQSIPLNVIIPYTWWQYVFIQFHICVK